MTRSRGGLLHKLRGRSAHELWVRGRQEVQKRCDLLAYRLSVQRPPRPRPSAGGRPLFFFDVAQVPRMLEIMRGSFAEETAAILERADRICAHEFDLLGYDSLSLGEPIDWHRDVVHERGAALQPWYRIPFLEFDAVGDHKIIWELNRHQHLPVLAKAFLLSDERRYLDELVRQWSTWVEKNPYPLGINWASALEVAFRSFSWIWVDQLLRGREAVPEDFRQALRGELGRHGNHLIRYLSTYFAPNTHLLGEGAALFFIGSLYPELPEATRWRRAGWKIVVDESEHQVRADGLHFEQSIYYHVYALDFFLHALLLARRNGVDVPQHYERTVFAMLDALARLSPTGVPPRMGDDDGGRLFDPSRNGCRDMLDPLSTGSSIFDRSDWKRLAGGLAEESLWLLGPAHFLDLEAMDETPPVAESTAFEDSGLYLMSDRRAGDWRLLVDAGPQGYGRSGHGHADALSVQLASADGDWLVDVGTCSYMRQPERDRFRGTLAHNTLTAGGVDQAIASGPFAWENIPQTRVDRWVSLPELDYLSARHDGYERSPTRLTHRRTVVGWDGMWLVRDTVIGESGCDLVVSWHLAPRLRVQTPAPMQARVRDGEQSLELLFCGSGWRQTVEDGLWSPAYGAVRPTRVIRLRASLEAPTEVATLIVPGSTTTRLEGTRTADSSIYRVTANGSRYRLVFPGVGDGQERSEIADVALYQSVDDDPESWPLIAELPSV